MQSDGFGKPLIMATQRVVLCVNSRASWMEEPRFASTSFLITRTNGRMLRLRPVRL